MTRTPTAERSQGAIRISEISTQEILARLQAYEVRVERLRTALDRATQRRDALKVVLGEFRVVDMQPPPERIPADLIEAIRGATVRQALIIIATHQDGVLRSGLARRAIEAAGLVASPMPPNRLWKEITLLRRFKKLHRGMYKLLPAEPSSGELFVRTERRGSDVHSGGRKTRAAGS